MPSPQSWEIIVDNGNLCPELRNRPDEYDRRVHAGIQKAIGYLEKQIDSPEPISFDVMKEVHRLVFESVYKDAGKVRSDFIQCGSSPWHTAHPPLIEKAMDHLHQEVGGLLRDAETDERKAHAVSYQTAQAWRLQPFNDGNTRTVTLCGLALAKQLIPGMDPPTVSWGEWKTALGESAEEVGPRREGNLAPACKALTGVELSHGFARLPNANNYAHEVEFALPSGEKAVCMAYGSAAQFRVENLAINSDFGSRILEESGKHPFPLPAKVVDLNARPGQEGALPHEVLELDETVFELSKQLTVVYEVKGQELRFLCPDHQTADLIRRSYPTAALLQLAEERRLVSVDSVRLTQDSQGNPALDVAQQAQQQSQQQPMPGPTPGH